MSRKCPDSRMPLPRCAWMPVMRSPASRASRRNSPMSASGRPNFDELPPVTTLSWWPAPWPGSRRSMHSCARNNCGQCCSGCRLSRVTRTPRPSAFSYSWRGAKLGVNKRRSAPRPGRPARTRVDLGRRDALDAEALLHQRGQRGRIGVGLHRVEASGRPPAGGRAGARGVRTVGRSIDVARRAVRGEASSSARRRGPPRTGRGASRPAASSWRQLGPNTRSRPPAWRSALISNACRRGISLRPRPRRPRRSG